MLFYSSLFFLNLEHIVRYIILNTQLKPIQYTYYINFVVFYEYILMIYFNYLNELLKFNNNYLYS